MFVRTNRAGHVSSWDAPVTFNRALLEFLRKQCMVNLLAAGGVLDPAQIGIEVKRDELQWKIFYDKDDLLGFPTGNLYKDPRGTIGDYNVSTGWLPLAAHMGYWDNEDVKRETAELLGRRRLS